ARRGASARLCHSAARRAALCGSQGRFGSTLPFRRAACCTLWLAGALRLDSAIPPRGVLHFVARRGASARLCHSAARRAALCGSQGRFGSTLPFRRAACCTVWLAGALRL